MNFKEEPMSFVMNNEAANTPLPKWSDDEESETEKEPSKKNSCKGLSNTDSK